MYLSCQSQLADMHINLPCLIPSHFHFHFLNKSSIIQHHTPHPPPKLNMKKAISHPSIHVPICICIHLHLLPLILIHKFMLTQQPQNHRPNANRATSTLNFEKLPSPSHPQAQSIIQLPTTTPSNRIQVLITLQTPPLNRLSRPHSRTTSCSISPSPTRTTTRTTASGSRRWTKPTRFARISRVSGTAIIGACTSRVLICSAASSDRAGAARIVTEGCLRIAEDGGETWGAVEASHGHSG